MSKPDKQPEIPAEVLSRVDLDLMPGTYADEAMGLQMVSHLQEYRKIEALLAAAKNVGDEARTAQMARELAFQKNAVAWIQWKYPDAKAVAKRIMEAEAARVKTRDEKGE